MLRAQYISTSLATVICECSLNQFSTSPFVSLFVHQEPQQIFVGINTEYGANVVKARVNVPITLLHIYWVCQYKLFLISEGWEGFTKRSDLHCMEYHWSDNQKISNSNTVFSSYILDSDFSFKYFLEFFGTKITLYF